VVSATPQTVIGTLPKAAALPKGDAAAGKAVFASAGCAACHTFKPAGSTAKIGPPLDDVAGYAKKANQPLDDFVHGAIVNPPPSYVPPGFPTNVMPTNFGTTLSPKQLADLVAFVTQGH
jgi:mono/diheme cytochrome c family protein